jgi:hypothetical protein
MHVSAIRFEICRHNFIICNLSFDCLDQKCRPTHRRHNAQFFSTIFPWTPSPRCSNFAVLSIPKFQAQDIAAVVQVLGQFKDAQMPDALKDLGDDQIDVLINYLYRCVHILTLRSIFPLSRDISRNESSRMHSNCAATHFLFLMCSVADFCGLFPKFQRNGERPEL